MRKSCLIILLNLLATLVLAQNANWTIPDQYLESTSSLLFPLPIPDPGANDEFESYIGERAENSHGAYSDVNGDLIFFTVDEHIYDKNGWAIDHLYDGSFGNQSDALSGYNERLILPMGDDCTRYAILFMNTVTGNYSSTSSFASLYMAVYDINGSNPYNSNAIGGLEATVVPGGSINYVDIGLRDGQAHGSALEEYYGIDFPSGNRTNYGGEIQIAATGLIDGCFYYIYVFDGVYVMRYKLTENDLEWDNYTYEVPQFASSPTTRCELRTEMELIQLSSGNFRLAIPYCDEGAQIAIVDIDGANGNILPSTLQVADLSNDTNSNDADPRGVEFNETGEYLYISHTPNLNLPNVLDVFDVSTGSFVSNLPTLTGISNFRDGFIERLGSKMIIAGDDVLGEFSNIDTPTSLSLDANWRPMSSGYGNDAGENNTDFLRYVLPDQIDMPYPDPLTDMSCECCRDAIAQATKYTAPGSDTWTASSNPFNTNGGSDVYIREELRIFILMKMPE